MRSFDLRQSEQQAASSSPKSVVTMLARSNEECGVAMMMLRSEQLTLREALASDQLEAFVRQEQARGVELAKGSELERALALLITQTQRRTECRSICRM